MATIGEVMAQGWQFHQAGNLDAAAKHYRQVLEVDPGHLDALYLLGAARQVLGDLDEAMACYRQVLAVRPGHAAVQTNLGAILAVRERYEEAVACYQQALRVDPEFANAYNNLGISLTELGRLDEAVAALEHAVRLQPNDPSAYYNLGNAAQRRGPIEKAVAAYHQALALQPGNPDVANNLGAALSQQGRLDEAIDLLQQALAKKPDSTLGWNNLANALRDQGRLDEALAGYRRALDLQPEFPLGHRNFLVALNYDPRVTSAELLEEHRRWDRLYGQAARGGPSPDHDRNPERRLRVGYVSPDFYDHAAAYFLEPILAHHDREQVETYCYAEVPAPDAVTDRFRSYAQGWRSTHGQTDAQVADQIRADRIDLLVDLAGHTGKSRLRVFAHQPAPVQLTYLGYPNTTGLRTINYWLVDAVTDPPGEPPQATEELWRLPGCFCCFAPPQQAPEVTPLPAADTGRLTLGSLQNVAKINGAVLDLWAALLRALPATRLLVFRHTLDGQSRQRMLRQFTERGIAADRIDLRHELGFGETYLHVYRAIDLSLDTFPWSGHTTACQSLWMGVPILTLYGTRHAGRMAASVLTCLGLDEFVARTPEEFVQRGVGLASDLERLAELRLQLRRRMLDSPLCDGKRFTRGLEAAYRTMWRRWCAGGGADIAPETLQNGVEE